MRTYAGKQIGSSIVIHLTKGEGLLESIDAEIKRLGVQNAVVVSGIGSLRKVCYHRIANTEDNPTNEYLTVVGPIELSAVQGYILDGEPHLHISCCDRERAFGGHLENGTEVQYLAEICIVELPDARLTRRNDEFGISYIDEK